MWILDNVLQPASKYYSTVADFSYTPLFQSKRRHQHQEPVEGRKLRQPSSSMMIGQVDIQWRGGNCASPAAA